MERFSRMEAPNMGYPHQHEPHSSAGPIEHGGHIARGLPQHPLSATPALSYGPVPMVVLCPYCDILAVTRVKYSTGVFSYIAAMVIAALGCVCGCCLLPCCLRGFKNAEHSCSGCNNYLGTFHRI